MYACAGQDIVHEHPYICWDIVHTHTYTHTHNIYINIYIYIYIGTKREKVRERRGEVKVIDYNRRILVEQHLRLNSHDFNRDSKCAIFDRIEKITSNNIIPIIKPHEGNWI